MRTVPLLVIALFAATFVHVAAPAAALGVSGVDGLTALITPLGPNSNDLLFTRDATGAIPVAVTAFAKGPAGWAPVSMGVTLRVFVLHADGTESDRASINFRSSATGPVTKTIPATALAPGDVLDVFLTFSDVGGSPVPTSHHSVEKNALIAQGQFDLAETFDYHHVVGAVAG